MSFFHTTASTTNYLERIIIVISSEFMAQYCPKEIERLEKVKNISFGREIPASAQFFDAPFPRLKRGKMQILGPLSSAADPVGQRGGRSVIVQHEVQSVMEQKDSSYGMCELFGVRIDVLFHSSGPCTAGLFSRT